MQCDTARRLTEYVGNRARERVSINTNRIASHISQDNEQSLTHIDQRKCWQSKIFSDQYQYKTAIADCQNGAVVVVSLIQLVIKGVR